MNRIAHDGATTLSIFLTIYSYHIIILSIYSLSYQFILLSSSASASSSSSFHSIVSMTGLLICNNSLGLEI